MKTTKVQSAERKAHSAKFKSQGGEGKAPSAERNTDRQGFHSSNLPLFQHSILPLSNSSILLPPNQAFVRRLNIPFFHFSTLPLFHFSILPLQIKTNDICCY